MCGIFAYVGTRDDAPAIVFKGIKLLEYRGYDSWGIAYIPTDGSGDFIDEKHIGKIGTASIKHPRSSHIAIGHTRWATHGGVTTANAHPHFDSQKAIAVIHNGIIENYQAIKAELVRKGYVFKSQTDTEVAAHLIQEYRRRFSLPQALSKAFNRFSGLNAFVVIDKQTREIYAVRRGSPLAVGFASDGYYIASDATAMSEYTDSVYFLNDHDLVVCHQQQVTLYNVRNMQKKPINWQHLDFSSQDLSLGSYRHFMLKEIMEQPKVLAAILDQQSTQIRDYAAHLSHRNIFVGCGSAYHAALTGSYLFSLIARQQVLAIIGSEFAYSLDFINSGVFTTFLSQSGETIDIVEHLSFLKKHQAPFGAIVNRLGSTLERSTDKKILLPAGPEQCVLATKSFTAKLAVLFLLSHQLAQTPDLGKTQLKKLVSRLPEILSPAYSDRYLKPLAKQLIRHAHIFIIGRGVSYPIALEAALKIKEVTYIHTEGFAAGELKHGVIALVEAGTPCVVFAPQDETYASMISNAVEMKSRGGFIIGISDKPNEVFDFHIPVSDFGILTCIPNVVVFQLLAYYMAQKLGNDPDKPRNLAKSVTVK